MSTSEPNFKNTLNLPQTDFPIRAGLINKEPELLKKWEETNLYQQLLDQQKSYPTTYLLHDGPPYPNGNIHMGHALNKVLKDIVVRSKTMSGQKSPYIPGWDCHGLPIETQVVKDLKSKGQENKKTDIPWFRQRCQEFALDYVKTQKEEFQRLGIMGEWEKPYLTLDKSYEAKVVELFGQMAEEGLIYRGYKPIHWCISCETALAEAEIEYQDHRSPSIYFRFKVTKATPALATIIQNQPCYVLVWTTTPWTLPANVAIAAHPDFHYLVIKHNNELYLMVKELKDQLLALFGWTETSEVAEITGQELLGTNTQHPFIERNSPIVNAEYVTKEDGTGFVHTAPGHGQEDYLTGLAHDLPMIMPVNEKGIFTDEVIWAGKKVFEANKDICQHMEANGSLIKLQFVKHSYPHCWRCKNPVIFRATEQWFIAMDREMKDGQTLRAKALAAIKKTKWHPSWGEKRINSMIENRPDWCISRQRFWGIPLPVFKCQKCNHPEMTGEFNQAAVDLMAKEGSIAWFSKTAKEILPAHLKCSKCGASDFVLETDILDVWFESGSSFAAVLENRPGLNWPAQLYLEGSDQHRGWFQSSLLIGLGARNTAPYQAVLTHGFLVDEKGKKMSKSEGNAIAPQSVLKDYGADILRWWIASADFRDDISISKNIFDQSKEAFGKVRNTIRFCLSNLFDFDPKTDLLPYDKMNELDQWALLKLNRLIEKNLTNYQNFEYHLITHSLHDFCAVTLSSLYLDMIKDRLYCGGKNSLERRSSQTALYLITDALLKIMAPILVFTAEDAYSYFNKKDKASSIHLETFPTPDQQALNVSLEKKWEKLLTIRELAYQKLEQLRNDKQVRSFLEAQVTITLPEPIEFTNWAAFLIVSQVDIKQGTELSIEAKPALGTKCERCWKVLAIKGDHLCHNCYAVVKP